MISMEGITTKEIAEMLGITPEAAFLRLRAKNIPAKAKIGSVNIYDPGVLDQIREVSKGGRPRKDK
jgi:hypothetical protein